MFDKKFNRAAYRQRIVSSSLGGLAAARNMTPEQRHDRAVKGALARWGRRKAAAGDPGVRPGLPPADSPVADVMGL